MNSKSGRPGLFAWVTLLLIGARIGKAEDEVANQKLYSFPQIAGFSLAASDNQPAATASEHEEDWSISGPVRMRSADPEGPGEIEIKNIFEWGTSSDGSDDDFEYELELEWGFAPNHELIFELPVELGDGRVDGNADITLGWHWRLWKEQDLLPAFALRNYIRTPSGIGSSGVDYELRGLFTKSIVPDQFRFHFNPYLKSVNGDDDEDARHFQWGLLAGVDYRFAEDLTGSIAYIYSSSETQGIRDQHRAELGLDWDFAEHQTLGLAGKMSLDGDSEGDDYAIAISYIISLDTGLAWGG